MSAPVTTTWLTLEAASAKWSTAVGTLRAWVAAGKVRATRPGRRVLVDERSLSELFERHARGGKS